MVDKKSFPSVVGDFFSDMWQFSWKKFGLPTNMNEWAENDYNIKIYIAVITV